MALQIWPSRGSRMLPSSYFKPLRRMPRTKDSPSSGALARSPAHWLQVGLGSSPGRGNSLANAPSKIPPPRSTNRNQTTAWLGLDSSSFCHSPATVGSCVAARRGVATVSTARPAMPSHVNGLFNCDILPPFLWIPTPSLRNMAISRRRGTPPMDLLRRTLYHANWGIFSQASVRVVAVVGTSLPCGAHDKESGTIGPRSRKRSEHPLLGGSADDGPAIEQCCAARHRSRAHQLHRPARPEGQCLGPAWRSAICARSSS